jgi:excinuclease UvrABC nuclease subunit
VNSALQPAGVAAIEEALATMPLNPGVYRMLDTKGNALYVGKARSLKKRVAAYTQLGRLPERLRRMVAETAAMEVITTHTEAEALLLEANLIKRLKPRFNIVLRDDKSYPWLMLTEDHPYPQIAKHRGAQIRKGSYWGPFASAWAVNQTVTAMQRVFLLRSCCVPVPIRFLPTGSARVCCIKFAAAPHLALAGSARRITRSWFRRRRLFSPASRPLCSANWRRRWSRRPPR